MARKRLGAEQIVTKLRQIEVLQAQGNVAEKRKDIGYCVWGPCLEMVHTMAIFARQFSN